MIRIERPGPGDAARAEEAIRVFKGRSRPVADVAAFLEDDANYLLVAEEEGETVGLLLAYRLERPDREESQMFIYQVDVVESRRQHGIGRALVAEIVRLARAAGAFEAFVLTSRRNEAARSLYARTGGLVEDDAAMLVVYPLGDDAAVSDGR